MRIIIASVGILAFCNGAYSAGPSDTNGEEECIFDQEAQHQTYLELEKKYAGSRYIEAEYKLVIPDDGDQIELRRGGCVHFGISIELQTSRTHQYDDEGVFLEKVIALVTDYGQGLINVEMLEQSMAAEDRHVSRDDTGAYYFLPYPDATFEMFLRHDKDHTTLGVRFYY